MSHHSKRLSPACLLNNNESGHIARMACEYLMGESCYLFSTGIGKQVLYLFFPPFYFLALAVRALKKTPPRGRKHFAHVVVTAANNPPCADISGLPRVTYRHACNRGSQFTQERVYQLVSSGAENKPHSSPGSSGVSALDDDTALLIHCFRKLRHHLLDISTFLRHLPTFLCSTKNSLLP